ncbi:mannose-1-phosphate guanylyltransferase/mannose-6-phosphate isomerase [Luteithermobacter gelatinilyticus]|uniref:mannose-1-phosphate guanylyltransferase/mannose-6-phosphate isomerase n=1 Tax=Luteithermobacter gelatinilyticus TaxID=2582913 RepID=UPI001106B1BD|nr:mannose-1-phosphate guanylyltransferase/mannose-6-phosphate isomerase [Luteithermobacter gelatinilyticus]
MSALKISPVILSGGSGTRLWPLSRALYPKQLLPLVTDKTMIQETVDRVADRDLFQQPLIIANEEHRFIVAEQLRQIGEEDPEILLEPEGRNTAPAAALAALYLVKCDPDAIMLIMPSDHIVKNRDAFTTALQQALDAVSRKENLATFGIIPTAPETGYGYIHKGAKLPGRTGCFKVARFVEKPDRETAEQYLADGNYYWNSGIFLFPAQTYLDMLEKFEPDILAACQKAMSNVQKDLCFLRPDKEAFLKCPANSIDYAVMEKTDMACVVPVDMGWNDIGSWSALWDVQDKDEAGNVIRGDVISLDSHDCYLASEGPAIAALGLKDIIAVATKDAVLISHKDHSQNVKNVVNRLAKDGREEHIAHTVVYRPWGSYETSDYGHRFQVKRLVVKPGQTLSLQKHHHRAEHWIVVQGRAEVTIDDKVQMLNENESTYIPIGAVHRLSNPGKIPLHIIEVQSGSYLGEDDIVRFEDNYGRN